jgi:hypothetical protein
LPWLNGELPSLLVAGVSRFKLMVARGNGALASHRKFAASLTYLPSMKTSARPEHRRESMTL